MNEIIEKINELWKARKTVRHSIRFQIKDTNGIIWDAWIPPHNKWDCWCDKKGTHGMTQKTFRRLCAKTEMNEYTLA